MRCRDAGEFVENPGQLGAFLSPASSMPELWESWPDGMHAALDIEAEQREVTHG